MAARGGEIVIIWHSNTRDNDKVGLRTKKIAGKIFCVVTERGGEGNRAAKFWLRRLQMELYFSV